MFKSALELLPASPATLNTGKDAAQHRRSGRPRRSREVIPDRVISEITPRVVLSAVIGYRTYRRSIGWGVIEPIGLAPLRGASGCTLGPYCSPIPRALWLCDHHTL